jgi:ornithine cyclodeaminase/alanine dehydrogenase-like protein (mu-crystallin family)
MTDTDASGCALTSRELLILDAAQTRARLPFERLIPALREAFVDGATVPLRHRHDLPQADGTVASLLLMPAWRTGGLLGVKLVSVFPGNGARGLPAVWSSYLLCDGETGRHLALIDGTEITGRRTAAASALAASFLTRADAAVLLVVGAGHIAGLIPAAYAVVRPIRHVLVWNIRTAGAERLASRLRTSGFTAHAVSDLADAVRRADIVSCATLARTPLIQGEWLRPGVHLDLIGSFTPTMREADDTAVRRARVFIDTDAALAEAGDLVGPLASGALRPADIAGDLARLCRREVPGRRAVGEITLFKSVGSALEDLAAAALAWHDTTGADTGCRASDDSETA